MTPTDTRTNRTHGRTTLVALSGLALLALVAGVASAHADPEGCTSQGVGISITVFRADGTTPVAAGTVASGETLKYQATVSHPGAPNCNFEGGSVTITDPSGTVQPVSGTVPLVSSGSPFVSSLATYVVEEAHVSSGFLAASADYSGGLAHRGEGNHPPVSATADDFTQFEDSALIVTKTADPTFDSVCAWTITKGVDVPTHTLANGATGVSEYTIGLTKECAPDNHAVTGTITIENPAEFASASITSVTDTISGVGAAAVECPVAFPHELAPGATLECTYSASLPNGDTRTNTATATTDGDVDGDSGEATIDFTGIEPTEVNGSIHVDDTFDAGDAGPISSSTSYTYERSFTCGTGEGEYQGEGNLVTNTATIVETGQFDNADVTVNCPPPLTVSKTADPTFDQDCTWTIVKSADPAVHDLAMGATGVSTYTIELDRTCTDVNHAVSGSITIENTAGSDATIESVTDSIEGVGAADVNCPVALPSTLAAGGTLVCTYSSSLPDGATRVNTATVTTSGPVGGGVGTADVDFTGVEPTTVNMGTVNVDDTFDAGDAGPFSSDASYTYERTFTCGEGEGEYTGTGNVVPNTATIVETGDSDDASVTVNCVVPGTPTRTQGFWKTHTAYTQTVFHDSSLGGTMTVGTPAHERIIDTDGKLFGSWYSDIASKTTGLKRLSIDKARMVLLQQLTTAKLNCAAFGCSAQNMTDIANADAAYAGTDKAAMSASTAILDAYNNWGDDLALPETFGPHGAATPDLSSALANRVFWDSP